MMESRGHLNSVQATGVPWPPGKQLATVLSVISLSSLH